MPPSTAITRMLISHEVLTEPGVIRPLYQTSSTPPTAAISAGQRIGRDAVRDHVEAERGHAPRVVADALQRDAERRAHHPAHAAK